MFRSARGLQQLADLRGRASTRLDSPGTGRSPASRATDALAVLHDMALSQDSAGDALALLHELQVHQVEVELQAEELRDSRSELEAALLRQTALYDAQPVACFTVTRDLVILELNLAGASLLEVPRDDACGLALGPLLAAHSAVALQQALLALVPGAGGRVHMVLEWLPQGGPPRSLRADIGCDSLVGGFLLVLSETTGLR